MILSLLGCASQQRLEILEGNFYGLDLRIAKIEKETDIVEYGWKSYQKDRGSKDTELKHQAANLRVEIEELRQEQNSLRGRLEEIRHFLENQLSEVKAILIQTEKIARENSIDIDSLEQQIDPEKHSLKISKKDKDIAKVEISKEDKRPDVEKYIEGKQAFDDNNLDLALEYFQELLKNFQDSAYADNAQFWIGEIYYERKWYEKAILEYQKAIEKYPKGNKIQASLFKQGLAFINIGDTANARLILDELIRKYPDSTEAASAKNKLDTLK